jgi:uncharacterized protein (UPF0303 family)
MMQANLERLKDQETHLVLAFLDLGAAWELGTCAVRRAQVEMLAVSIQVRLGERTVFSAAMPGSTAVTDDWAARKARVVHGFEQSSLLVRRSHEASGIDFEGKHGFSPLEYRAFGGAFPLRDASGFRGSLSVSGLSEEEDHAFCVSVLEEFLTPRRLSTEDSKNAIDEPNDPRQTV